MSRPQPALQTPRPTGPQRPTASCCRCGDGDRVGAGWSRDDRGHARLARCVAQGCTVCLGPILPLSTATSTPQNQKLFSDFLAENTKGATDLQEDYAKVVADSWDKFFASDCGSNDPTCDLAHEQLGRWARVARVCPVGISQAACCSVAARHLRMLGQPVACRAQMKVLPFTCSRARAALLQAADRRLCCQQHGCCAGQPA